MAKRKRAAREAIIDKTLNKKLLIEIEQHEHDKKNWGALRWSRRGKVPAPQVGI